MFGNLLRHECKCNSVQFMSHTQFAAPSFPNCRTYQIRIDVFDDSILWYVSLKRLCIRFRFDKPAYALYLLQRVRSDLADKSRTRKRSPTRVTASSHALVSGRQQGLTASTRYSRHFVAATPSLLASHWWLPHLMVIFSSPSSISNVATCLVKNICYALSSDPRFYTV